MGTGDVRCRPDPGDAQPSEDAGRLRRVRLKCQNLDEVLSKACSLVADVLGTGRAKVLEIHHAGECLFARAGAGWGLGIVGQLSSPSAFAAGLRSSRSGFGKDRRAA